MLNKNVETFIGGDKPSREAALVIFGAPFDSTTSYRPGTRFASKTMRTESYGIETYSPYQGKDLEDDASVFDAGDLELCIGDVGITLNQIEDFTAQILREQKRPVMIGGEHLVTLAAIRAAHKKYPDLHVIHFDAHADLRDDYLGAKLSHATVMRRVWELLGDGKIHQFGIRSGDKSEVLWSPERVYTQKFNFSTLEDTVHKLKDKPVYFSLDLDVLDPSVFPGTGTPEAGGVSFHDVMAAISLLSQLNIVGFDMVELSPTYDPSGISTAIACKLLRELLLIFT
jgi:agmatinase